MDYAEFLRRYDSGIIFCLTNAVVGTAHSSPAELRDKASVDVRGGRYP